MNSNDGASYYMTDQQAPQALAGVVGAQAPAPGDSEGSSAHTFKSA